MFSAFGGTVDVTGEILHGKTSPLRHDSKGVYAGLPQDLPVTRYHSLAGTHPTLPDCLEVSSWIAKGPDGGKGVIMGVRHKKHLVEGVQFHPESILTEEGRTMLKNFLKMQGGTWPDSNVESTKMVATNGTHDTNNQKDKSPSILDKIFDRRKELVAAQKEIHKDHPICRQRMISLSHHPRSPLRIVSNNHLTHFLSWPRSKEPRHLRASFLYQHVHLRKLEHTHWLEQVLYQYSQSPIGSREVSTTFARLVKLSKACPTDLQYYGRSSSSMSTRS